MSDIFVGNPENEVDTGTPAPLPEEPPPSGGPRRAWHPSPRLRLALIITGSIFGVFLIIATFYYLKFARLSDQKLENGVFADTLNIFAAPKVIGVGDHLSQEQLVTWLREHGYNTSSGNPGGWYEVRTNAVGIFPGHDASAEQDPGVVYFNGEQVARIVSSGNKPVVEYEFAPQLLANVSDKNREKRRLVRFNEIPRALVDAVVSTEDKHFFRHNGVDVSRIIKAAYVDLRDGRKQQGASTLTMQLARGIWLDPDKRWKRKIAEFLLTLHLEHKLTKQQIFTYYSNEVYMGRRGTFSINGFGEAAHSYFGKDISQLTIPEAALLAGMVQRPSYYNPFRYPERATERRNLVLRMMRENDKLTDAQYSAALATPLKLHAGELESVSSQYFIDLANDEMQTRMADREHQNDLVYTTLDEDLQRAAVESVRIGMQEVDAQLRKRKHAEAIPAAQPQVALIALDPHTGEIKALVGGRDYGASQLNHVTAERQPGSVFKPFVYAAALDSALGGSSHVYTAATVMEDEPTTFTFGHTVYRPNNFEQNFMGEVTLRQALAHSLNVATVKLAQGIGYQAVVDMARRAGLNNRIQATPAVALGSYVCTPLEIAGAYTMFANNGSYVKPILLASVRTKDSNMLYQHSPDARPALDPRVNYLMVNLMEEVLRSGTGAGARARGFRAPAAGKTGTSRDGWFAGFTSRLLCIVWVGFDDYRELGLEGAKSALPIWTEFMKRASLMHAYRDVKEFPVPAGITTARLCQDSHQLAGPNCPNTYGEYFIEGSQPPQCEMHSGEQMENPNVSGSVSDPSTAPLPLFNPPSSPLSDSPY